VESSCFPTSQLVSTDQIRSRIPGFIRGDVYTPGATSHMQEARKPRTRSEALRVTTTVIDIGDGAMGFAAKDRVFVAQTLRWKGLNGIGFVDDDGTPVAPADFPVEHVRAMALVAKAMLAKYPKLVEERNGAFYLTQSGEVALRYVRGE